MEQILEVLKFSVIAILAIGYLIKILKGEQAESVLESLVSVIERLGIKGIKGNIAMTMAKTEGGNSTALHAVVQKVTKGKKASKIWKIIKFALPFVI